MELVLDHAAQPLLRFHGDRPVLMDAGLNELQAAKAPVRVIDATGKGRCGKSWLLNRCAGREAFQTSDGVQAATEGVDILVQSNSKGGSLVWLDTEGADNALADTRPKASVLAQVLVTEVLSVAAHSFDVTSIEWLGKLAALRQLLRGCAVAAQPRLNHVVNFCVLKGFEEGHLLTALTKEGEKTCILEAFEVDSLHTVPFGTDQNVKAVSEAVAALKARVLNGRPAQCEGHDLSGQELVEIATAATRQLAEMDEVDLSGTFGSILAGACRRIADTVLQSFSEALPRVAEMTCFRHDVDEMDKVQSLMPLLADFDSKTQHISNSQVCAEVKKDLEMRWQLAFDELQSKNNSLAEAGRVQAQALQQKLLREYCQQKAEKILSEHDPGHKDQQIEESMARFWRDVQGVARPTVLEEMGRELSEALTKHFSDWQKRNRAKEELEKALLKSKSQEALRQFREACCVGDDRLEQKLRSALSRCIKVFEKEVSGRAREGLILKERRQLQSGLECAQEEFLKKNDEFKVEQISDELFEDFKATLDALEVGSQRLSLQMVEETMARFENRARPHARANWEQSSPMLRISLMETFATCYHQKLCHEIKETCRADAIRVLNQCQGDLTVRHVTYNAWFEQAAVQETYERYFLMKRMQPEETAYDAYEALQEHVRKTVQDTRVALFGEGFVRQQIEAARTSFTTRKCMRCGIPYQKEAGCNHVRCGFMDWNGGGEWVQPPRRGINGISFGCGYAFDWNVAQDVTEEEWARFFAWTEFPTQENWFSSLVSGVSGTFSRVWSWFARPEPPRILGPLQRLQAQLLEERESLPANARGRRFKQHLLDWHPDRCHDAVATEATQYLNEVKDWYLSD